MSRSPVVLATVWSASVLLAIAGLLVVVNSFATAYGRYGDSGVAGRLPGTVTAAWISQWIWGPAVTPAAAFLFVGFMLVGLTNGTGIIGWLVWLVGVVALPAATAIAILRYRLYEIDRIISRTLVYALLTAVMAASYVGLVLAGQALFSSFAGGSNLAIAASTLVVAALFLPVRSRGAALRRPAFHRRRYDAQRTLAEFGSRLREQVDLQTLVGELRSAVDETMQPAHVALWLRGGERP